MKVFADTNWIVAAYFRRLDPKRTFVVDRFSAKFDRPWMVSAIVALECENTFRLIGAHAEPPEWRSLQSDFGSRLNQTEDSWISIEAKAKVLFRQFSCKSRIGTLDTMILASAILAGATHFLSFDSNSNLRALASVLKLKVFPELTPEDKRRMTAFR